MNPPTCARRLGIRDLYRPCQKPRPCETHEPSAWLAKQTRDDMAATTRHLLNNAINQHTTGGNQ